MVIISFLQEARNLLSPSRPPENMTDHRKIAQHDEMSFIVMMERKLQDRSPVSAHRCILRTAFSSRQTSQPHATLDSLRVGCCIPTIPDVWFVVRHLGPFIIIKLQYASAYYNIQRYGMA